MTLQASDKESEEVMLQIVRSLAADRELLDMKAPMSAEPVVTLNGAQLLQALDFIAPDRGTDPQQLECELTISFADGPAGGGYYCYCTDYPDEGAIMLDAEATSAPVAAQAKEPTLDKPAKVGNGRFGVGIKWSTVIAAAQRHYEYEVTPSKEAKRIKEGAQKLGQLQELIGAQTQQVDRSPEMQGKPVDNHLDLQGHASVIFAKAVAWADARVESALIQEQGKPHGQSCDEAAQTHYELVQALRNLQAAQQPVSGADWSEALSWYAEQVAGCRKIGSPGDTARQALDADGGKRARAALAQQDADKVDAERYRLIRAKVYASNATGRKSWSFHYDNLPTPLSNPMKGSVAGHFDDAIDAARKEHSNA
ncbi:hypothetical protein NIZ92_06455 [Alcaligenes sp. 1735tsa3]|uniref:hypothetical protein n=1 Tax=Alcaligenes sp. 1735tsa3 TaxID=2953809 RepID=UPI0020A79DF2|nr:hypothetical protein [Alcaligenes sp. 1735tsa3]USY26673.1 hypothetical protein NIZ92_06455 [Alcaligenes sp. 1735tsa3]